MITDKITNNLLLKTILKLQLAPR